MKALAITSKGLEDISALEIKELTGNDSEQKNGCVVFDFEKFEDLFLVCYKTQSVSKIILLLDSFKLNDLGDFDKKKIDFGQWADAGTRFIVRAEHIDSELSSPDLEDSLKPIITSQTDAKIDYKKHDTVFFVFVSGKQCFVGVDFSKEDLAKRSYRIFTGSDTLKANTAYSLVRISKAKKGNAIIDPFCFSGTVAIESALFFSDYPAHFFDKDDFLFLKLSKFSDFDFERFFSDVDRKIKKKIDTKITALDPNMNAVASAKKNAKIAGVNKLIDFSRKETDWLELKFEKNSVDNIVTHLPEKNVRFPEDKLLKMYGEFFYQAEYILNQEGNITILTNEKRKKLVLQAAEKYKFKSKHERKIMQGKAELTVMVFTR